MLKPDRYGLEFKLRLSYCTVLKSYSIFQFEIDQFEESKTQNHSPQPQITALTVLWLEPILKAHKGRRSGIFAKQFFAAKMQTTTELQWP